MRRFLFTVVFLFATPALADTYVIDPAQTRVRIAVKMCEADLLIGDFVDVEGKFSFDEKEVEKSQVGVNIKAASGKYNHEMHKTDPIKSIIEGEKILDTQKFPDIT